MFNKTVVLTYEPTIRLKMWLIGDSIFDDEVSGSESDI